MSSRRSGYSFDKHVASPFRNLDKKEVLPKSPWYRDSIETYIGMRVTVQAMSFDVINRDADKIRICLQGFQTSINDDKLDLLEDWDTVDHMRVEIPIWMKRIDVHKPIIIVGYLYEYSYFCKRTGTRVRNIGLMPVHVSQRNLW